MMTAFISIRILDILDVILVAFMLYKIYMAIKGTVAYNIFMGIFIFYITWIIIKGLNMELMGNIMGQVMAAGVLALIVVFQQEIRKMFLTLGTHYNLNKGLSIDNLFSIDEKKIGSDTVRDIVTACERMSRSKTGALIVLTNKAELNEYIDTGEKMDAIISIALLETLFFKNTPLHDGGVIIQGNLIRAARCILPVSNKKLKNVQLGLRHRAALGMSMATDAQVIIVSEETGRISYAFNGKLKENINPIELSRLIEEVYAQ
jgi:diadenylate cyclase